MIFTRRQIETTIAATIAGLALIIGIADRISGDDPILGPKFLGLERVGAFNQPVHVAQVPGTDLLAIVEKPGRVSVVGELGRKRTFLDIRKRVKDTGVGGEQGLLAIAFHPRYRGNGRFYVSYTDRRNALRIVEFRRAGAARAARGSAREVLRIPQPTSKHHSGMLLFGVEGAERRLLYVGSGDGGPSGDPNNVAQNKFSLLGKILRINPLKRGRKPYTIPKDNPYAGRRGRAEIYSRGLRNPWRFAIDRGTGAVAVADVGDAQFEEVNQLESTRKLRGANFGWSAYEGPAVFKGGLPRKATVRPLISYPHGPGCSVTGGPFIRDPSLRQIRGAEVYGRYLFGDFCSGNMLAVRPRPGKRPAQRRLRLNVKFLSSFGVDAARRIYITSLEGPVFRIIPRRKEIG